ncbi:hypothetical protein CVV68_05775 [Arthrobacter livingstonensis]|uniref:Probable membrane transporter protein n=1 Tax=Arthrobacter livingstonensis TaxID=670078 RepID=A0A2V5LD13_9MICC|nr:sulfite exporter TauE/SafE family protein [Arthrobacter livingstonensis]PYI68792.1 hypothetical protein CVV68_05775 [Arthrobacter livingstonensis]
MTIALLAVAILVGASLQRLTGMGFALVSAPFMVLLLGPVSGVVTVNIASAAASAMILGRVFGDIDWRKFSRLAPAALVGIVPGALLLRSVPAAWLDVGIGVLIILSRTVSLLAKPRPREPGAGTTFVAGTASGAMNVLAGVGGPAMSVYAVATRWEQRSFAATMQPYFMVTALASIAAKLITSPVAVPALPAWAWLAACAAMVLGLVAGEVAAKHVTHDAGRLLVVILAFAGGAAATVRGVAAIL